MKTWLPFSTCLPASNVNWRIAAEEDTGKRLDRFLQANVPDLSRARLQELVREGHVTLNDRPAKASASLKAGDAISLIVPDAAPVEVLAQDIPLTVLYEDGDIIVVDKPSGLVVHPAAGNPDGTLVNALLHHCKDLSGIGGELRPGIVHRLDKDTSGCLVAAKHDRAHRQLTDAFTHRRISKIYLTVVQGRPAAESGRIENHLGRHPVDRKRQAILYDGTGKEAVTEWKILSDQSDASLIQCRLLTGRTHQIRVHMKEALRCPILGDPIYANLNRQKPKVPRLMLHAWKLAFEHPLTLQPLSFEAAIPPEFQPWTESMPA